MEETFQGSSLSPYASAMVKEELTFAKNSSVNPNRQMRKTKIRVNSYELDVSGHQKCTGLANLKKGKILK